MAAPHRKLRAVSEREGNPSKRPLPDGIRFAPEAPDEPIWAEPFPDVEVGRKPGRAPTAPRRPPPKGASDEERTAYRLAHLAWVMEMLEHKAEVRAYDDRKRLQAEAVRARKIAHEMWTSLIQLLDSQGIVAVVDRGALADHCILSARIEQAERDITQRGVWVMGERGAVKNPSTTFVNQCREKDRPYLADFGLTPAARDKLNPRGGDDPTPGRWD